LFRNGEQKDTMNQSNKKLDLWKDKQDQQIFSQTNPKKGRRPKLIN
jgi:hypothetical protein